MIRTAPSLIDAAERIGRTLCAGAYWHEGRCNWVGRSPREAVEPGLPLTPTVTALGPELYSGTAGIALFLAHLHARTDFEPARATARGAILHALWRGEALPAAAGASFYSGPVGIAYAAIRVGALIGDPSLIAEGCRLAQHALAARDRGGPLDVIGGNGGAVAPLLWLATLSGGEALLGPLTALATELDEAAAKRDRSWCWENERASGRGIGPTPLCGFAHGASGMGLALIEAGVQRHRPDWIEGGLAAFRYEDRLYDEERENWPDLREFGPPPDGDTGGPRPASFMVAWCHGAAGIGLARLRAVRLLPERRAELLPGIARAIRTTAAQMQSLPADSDASPCHGRAGLAETLLYATAVLGERQHADQAVRSWTQLLRTRRADDDWPCGVASGRNNPSLMLGQAGIGYALLRAVDPDGVPSILVIEPERQPAV